MAALAGRCAPGLTLTGSLPRAAACASRGRAAEAQLNTTDVSSLLFLKMAMRGTRLGAGLQLKLFPLGIIRHNAVLPALKKNHHELTHHALGRGKKRWWLLARPSRHLGGLLNFWGSLGDHGI